MLIKDVKAKSILDSNGSECIEVSVNNSTASIGYGISRSSKEAIAYPPQGVGFVVNKINNELALKLKGMKIESYEDLEHIEEYFDTKILGHSALVALEMAALKAIDNEVWRLIDKTAFKLPTQLGNCIGGGAHIKANDAPDIQEFLLIPRTDSFEEGFYANLRAYKLIGSKLSTQRKDMENAFVPRLSCMGVLDLLQDIVLKIKDELGVKLDLGLDVAASQLCKKGNYVYKNFSNEKKEKSLTTYEQMLFLSSLVQDFNVRYIEDPFQENDFESFSKLKKLVKSKCLVTGDDLTSTNPLFIKKAIQQDSINAVIIKPNQIGSLLKMREAVFLAKDNKIQTVFSHRSGETLDSTIAQLAFGFQSDYVKFGIFGKERVVKLKELIKIEKSLILS